MPIQFTCPHCGLQTNVSDEYAGQSGPCAGCGKAVTVPVPGAPPAYAPPARRSQGPVVLIIIVVAVLGAVVICGGIPVALLLPAVQGAREAARRSQCANNLKQIGVAMHNYHNEFNCFPPAYIPDENGKPKHSWRVLILPFLEAKYVHDQYDFDEPWDSPNNRALASMMPSVYRCPSEPGSNVLETSYVMIVGPKTISDGPSATNIIRITDGTAVTIMIVEVNQSGINWMEPRDLEANKISFGVNIDMPGDSPGEISSYHPGGAQVAMCDGTVHFLYEGTDPEEVESMSTIAGGEDISELDY